jgi:hypothetical protein
LCAAAGIPDIKEKMAASFDAGGGKKFKVHLDGYNFMPYFQGKAKLAGRERPRTSPRHSGDGTTRTRTILTAAPRDAPEVRSGW